ncbi:MAG: hypothetical protein IPM80_19035 [Proteobacteria bacterium]|nr:hypothetical protein [Pseudomonadota bacterium]
MAAAWLLLVAGDASAAGKVIEAHGGSRQGTVYEATPQPYAPPTATATAAAPGATPARSEGASAAPSVSDGSGGSAPREAGAGVEIISGGGSSAGAARVGRMPVLQ